MAFPPHRPSVRTVSCASLGVKAHGQPYSDSPDGQGWAALVAGSMPARVAEALGAIKENLKLWRDGWNSGAPLPPPPPTRGWRGGGQGVQEGQGFPFGRVLISPSTDHSGTLPAGR